MQRYGLLILVLFINIGCVQQYIPQEDVAFLDTAAFDKSLSNQMAAGLSHITVTPTSAFKIDAIPERLSRWLDQVVEYKGSLEVEPKPEKQAQSVEWMINMLPTVYSAVYDYIDTKQMYSTVQNYNATIFYKPETNLVQKVVFLRKNLVN